MVRAIIFDCFGVLTTDKWRAFLDTLPPAADIERARDLNRALDSGIISYDDFLSGVAEATSITASEIERNIRGEVVKNVSLLSYIRNLKQQYRIGLLSNISSDWITREFLSKQEQTLFDMMVFSYQTGMVKPDPRIYMLACERLRSAPHETVMVDDVEGYVAAAKSEGLEGIVYTDLEDFKQQLSLLTQLHENESM